MHKYLHFDSIHSTNTYLKEHYKELSDGTVVYADHQTQGKGRLGRVWNDDSKSLVFSILLTENLDANRVSQLPLVAGACMAKTLEGYNLAPQVKWPNDVLLNGRKACGILVEAVSDPDLKAVIIGVGLNLNDESFAPEIKDKAISLHQVTGKTYEKEEVLHLYMGCFDNLYQDYKDNNAQGSIDIINDHFYLKDKEVYLNYYGEDLHAKVLGITQEGKLIIKSEKGEEEIDAGEVTLEQNYGK